MQIPETPRAVSELSLMKRLDDYAEGLASWHEDAQPLGEEVRKACRALHTGLFRLIDHALAPLLDRISAREMETFTMHDRMHGNKVAHLMWHILEDQRRERLTPAEIGLLVGSAFLHDVGMALSPAEREVRLAPESDLWERLEIDEVQKEGIDQLRERLGDSAATETQKIRTERLIAQAHEVLLAQDTRERHATPERYKGILQSLEHFTEIDPENVPHVKSVFSFDGDSFLPKLLQVCISHNQDAEALVERDEEDFSQFRFPQEYPVGCCVADLHMVAAALRLADILDFDRERTPPVLFHYLLPGALSAAAENRSVLEWGKHLTIANWHIQPEALVYRGRSKSHVIHHAVVQFASVIEKEIDATRATFGALGEKHWPFVLPRMVQAQITAEGYRYVPYRFELDDDRVYNLLMGGAIYDNSLVAIRELIQNAVDACKLRDALTKLHEPGMTPSSERRIVITYTDPDDESIFPSLSIADTGTGMDAWIIERFFLKVGRSFYRSSEFNRTRLQLKRGGLDFAPVSEFGIGFLASFLLADQVIVETAMWDSIRGDTRKRTLTIDGPTRLIRLNEQDNTGPSRFRGTTVTLTLTRGGNSADNAISPLSYNKVVQYIRRVCRDLPYSIAIEHCSHSKAEQQLEMLKPKGSSVMLTPEERRLASTIQIDSTLVTGEVAILAASDAVDGTRVRTGGQGKIVVKDLDESTNEDEEQDEFTSKLLRGGFLVGEAPGLPEFTRMYYSTAVIAIKPNPQTQHFHSTNVARNATVDSSAISRDITRSWFTYMLRYPTAFPPALIWSLHVHTYQDNIFLDSETPFNALELYRFARTGWVHRLPPRWLSAWEACRMGAIPLRGVYGQASQRIPVSPSGGLLRLILNSVLPHMCMLIVTPRHYYAEQPEAGWQQLLFGKNLNSLHKPAWPVFAKYRGAVEHVLGFQVNRYLQHLNYYYSDRFKGFAPDVVQAIPTILDELIDVADYGKITFWNPQQWTLLQQVCEVAGDLLIGSERGLDTISALIERVPVD